jgi:hypothetical protein
VKDVIPESQAIDEMKRLFPLVVQTILLVDSNMPERHQSS